jgi:tRNA (guanine26-N2/guanine27-N2)-dimethyltransferase
MSKLKITKTSQIQEGKAKITVNIADTISKQLEVFYNPLMKEQRDITVAIVSEFFKNKENIRVGLPLEGSGVRGVRLMLESKIPVEVNLNDINPSAIKLMKKNFSKNKITKNFSLFNLDANVFLRTTGWYDFIDIDPFGSSIPFIDSAIYCLHGGGLLAITNTDTAALCGSYPKTTLRRYGSKPFNHAIRHEFGLRILIKRVQEIAAMQDKALIPVFSYSRHHYMRVFFKCIESKSVCNDVLASHSFVSADEHRILKISEFGLGPIYVGALQNSELINALDPSFEVVKLLQAEQKFSSPVQFFDLHELSKLLKRDVPKFSTVMSAIENQGGQVSRTLFSKTAIKTNLDAEKVIKILKEL